MPLGIPAGIFGPATFVGGVAVGTGVGGAVAGALEPLVLDIRHSNLAKFPVVPLRAFEAAQLVANGERGMGWGAGEAAQNGINAERFAALVDMIDSALDVAALMEAWRREIINEGQFREGARKHGIEAGWVDVLVQLKNRPLSPAESAAAWQQGYMEEGPASDEAELSGVTPTRSQIQRQLAGLPPGIQDVGMRLLRRAEWDDGTFVQAVRESNIKTKYAPDLLKLRWEVTSPTTAAGLHLRGWITEGERNAIGALSGYGPEQMEHLYLNRGRPATVRQVHIGYARGETLPGAANEEEAIRTAVKQSNIRTEYADLLYAQRYTYPSAFVLRALVADGTFTAEQGEQILVESGWRPDYAALAAEKWSGGAAGVGAKWADRARSRLFTVAHNEYLDGSIDDAQASGLLSQVGATAGEIPQVLTLWQAERGIQRLELTPSQIKKAYKKGPPDGYDYDFAVAELVERGMTPEDADTFLTT